MNRAQEAGREFLPQIAKDSPGEKSARGEGGEQGSKVRIRLNSGRRKEEDIYRDGKGERKKKRETETTDKENIAGEKEKRRRRRRKRKVI